MSSSSSTSSSSTRLNSNGSTATTSKSVPHSGQETTSPSSTSSSSISRSLSHSGQITIMMPSVRHRPGRLAAAPPALLYLESLAKQRQVRDAEELSRFQVAMQNPKYLV